MPDAGAWLKHYTSALEADRREDRVAAMRSLNRAIQVAPERWEAYYARAWLRLKPSTPPAAPDLDAAERDLREAISRAGPFAADATALLAGVRLQQGAHREALDLGLRALGKTTQPGPVQEAVLDALCALLDDLEGRAAADAKAALAECDDLEHLVSAAALPPDFTHALVAEILATQLLLHDMLPDRAAAGACQARLVELAPGHVALAGRDPVASKAAAAGPQNGSGTSFENVGGLSVGGEFQSKMHGLFQRFFGNGNLSALRQELQNLGEPAFRSVLLFGPSGCGKTFIIRSMVGEYRRRFGGELALVEVRLNEVFDRYVGESEKALTKLFDRAARSQPSLLFVDEVDALGSARDSTQDWLAAQTSHFLQEMDRLAREGALVLMVGATNRLGKIEPALLRRFDEIIAVELPSAAVRRDIFRVIIEGMSEALRPDPDGLDEVVRLTHGFAAGDIARVMRRAKDSTRTAADGTRRLTVDDIMSVIESQPRPAHLQAWLRGSLEVLRGAGLEDQAERVQALYAPFVDGPITSLNTTPTRGVVVVPPAAWAEQQAFNLESIRRLWRGRV